MADHVAAELPSTPILPVGVSLDDLLLMSEMVTDMVYQTTLTGIIIWISPSVKEMLGWEPAELVGTQALDIIHPEDVPSVRFHRARIDAGENIEDRTVRFLTKSGAHRWMTSRLRPVTDKDGKMIARVVGVRDMHKETTVRKALQTLSKGNAVLVRATNETDLLQSMCDTIAEAGQYLFAWYLRPAHDSEKSMVRVAWSGGESDPTSQTAASWNDEAASQGLTGTALRTRQIQVTDGAPNDPLTRPWMTALDAARIHSSITLPVFVDGRLDGVLAVFGAEPDEFDEEARAPLTDLAEALGYGLGRLRDQVRLRTIVDSLMDAHVTLEPVRNEADEIIDFLYLDANQVAARDMMLERSQIIGRRLLDILPGHARSGELAMYANVVESGEPLVIDNHPYANELVGHITFSDIRAIRVNDVLSVTWRDVTDRYASAVALASSEEQYRLLADNSTDVVLRLHLGVIGWVSPSIKDMLGWTQEDLIGRNLDELLLPEDLENYIVCKSLIAEGQFHVTRFRMLAKDLTYHWIEIRAKPYIDAVGDKDGAVASFHTIDTQVAAEESLERRARYDELTGLLNRNDILEQLAAISRRTPRTGDAIAVMFCDVDSFKSVNDSNGHAVGDQVLRTIASRIEGSVRRGDLIARIGGDEFLVILDGVHDQEEAVRIAEKLRRRVSRPIEVLGGVITATLSIGVTLAEPKEDVHALIARADQAMYKAKRAGSDQVIAIGTKAD